jgi:hypothetical protein
MAKNTTDRDVLMALGKDALVEQGVATVWQFDKWVQKDRGIPWRARGKVAALAAKKRVPVPADFMHERRPV